MIYVILGRKLNLYLNGTSDAEIVMPFLDLVRLVCCVDNTNKLLFLY